MQKLLTGHCFSDLQLYSRGMKATASTTHDLPLQHANYPGQKNPILDAMDRPDFRAIHLMLERVQAMGQTISGYPLARPADFSAVTSALESVLTRHIRKLETGHRETIDEFFSLVADFEQTPIRVYGNEALRLQFLKARALIAIGQSQDALDIVEPWAEQPYRIEGGFEQIQEAFELDLLARLMLGRMGEVGRLTFPRVLLLSQLSLFGTPFIFNRFFRQLSVTGPGFQDTHWLQPILRLGAGLCIYEGRGGRRSRFDRILWRLIRNVILLIAGVLLIVALFLPGARGKVQLKGAADAKPQSLKARAPEDADKPAILVTRAMGGLGDIMMMTPGLHALRLKHGRKIAFAIPKKFHAAFQGNPDYDLLDSDSFIDLGQYLRWTNLGICPAGHYESRVAPNIKKGRVELFARAMGIKKGDLNRYGWSPKCILSAEQVALIDSVKARAAEQGLPLIGFQIHSRDTYKDYPRLNTLLSKLAERAVVLAIHTSPSPIPTHPNIVPVFNVSLGEAVAMVAASEVFLAVDSGFYHFAAAFDIPAIGLFGPTSGKTFSKHHKRFTLVEVEPSLACSPCWRNEDQRCTLNGSYESACMAGIEVEQVIKALDVWLRP